MSATSVNEAKAINSPNVAENIFDTDKGEDAEEAFDYYEIRTLNNDQYPASMLQNPSPNLPPFISLELDFKGGRKRNWR